jgi:hypothetical protein
MLRAPITSLPVTLNKFWDQTNFNLNEAQRYAILHVTDPSRSDQNQPIQATYNRLIQNPRDLQIVF